MTSEINIGDYVEITLGPNTQSIARVLREHWNYTGGYYTLNKKARERIINCDDPRMFYVRLEDGSTHTVFELECHKLSPKEVFKLKLKGDLIESD